MCVLQRHNLLVIRLLCLHFEELVFECLAVDVHCCFFLSFDDVFLCSCCICMLFLCCECCSIILCDFTRLNVCIHILNCRSSSILHIHILLLQCSFLCVCCVCTCQCFEVDRKQWNA